MDWINIFVENHDFKDESQAIHERFLLTGRQKTNNPCNGNDRMYSVDDCDVVSCNSLGTSTMSAISKSSSSSSANVTNLMPLLTRSTSDTITCKTSLSVFEPAHAMIETNFISNMCDVYHEVDDLKNVTVFVDKPNKKLFCALCNLIFKHPVIVTCGHTFCKVCVMHSNSKLCPIDNHELSILVDNKAVEDQIYDLIIYCKNGIVLDSLTKTWKPDFSRCLTTFRIYCTDHENQCEYDMVKCPHNPECPQLFRKDLEDHLQICEHVLCHHSKYGCSFHGTSDSLNSHLEKECVYDKMKDFLWQTEGDISDLEETLNQKDEEIKFLKSTMGVLVHRFDSFQKLIEDKLENYEANQLKLYEELSDIRNGYAYLQEEVIRQQKCINQATGMGVYDPQPIFKCKGTCVGHTGPVWCLCISRDYLFSGSSDNTIKVWDIANNYNCLKTLEGHSGIVLALGVYGNKLYSGSQDQTIGVWNMETFTLLSTLHKHENHVCTLAIGKGMLFSGSLKVIHVWDALNFSYKQSLSGFNHWVRALDISGPYLYSGSFQTIKIWDLDTFECVKELEISGGSVYSIASTSMYIICGTYENMIHIWNIDNYHVVTTLKGHTGTVYALAVLNSNNGSKLFSASYDRSLRVWSMDNLICTQTLVRHEGSVVCLAISHGCIFSGAVDGTVKVWH